MPFDFKKYAIKDTGLIKRLTHLVEGYNELPKNQMFEKHKISPCIELTLRNIFERGTFLGIGVAWLSIRPHNIFNNGVHNGNDFTVDDCIRTNKAIFDDLGIKECEYDLLQTVGMEFGVNMVLPFEVEQVVNGFLYYRQTPFIVNKYPFNRITGGTGYKRLKVYAKGIQMHEKGITEIPRNTLRFELKVNEAKKLRKYGFYTANDLFRPKLYQTLFIELEKDFKACLWVDLENDFGHCKYDEKRTLKSENKPQFWSKKIRTENYRKIARVFRAKMCEKSVIYKTLLNLLMDKVLTLNNYRNSIGEKRKKNSVIPLRTRVKRGISDKAPQKCSITGLDISMQKEGSFYLSEKIPK